MSIHDPVERMITQAKVHLLFHHAFFGNIATRLVVKNADDWCPTMAVDGRRLYYNREFVKSLSKEELAFVVGHEVLHCVFDHFGRRGSREPGLWNMANDYVVNSTLKEENIGKMPERIVVDDKSKEGKSQRVGLYDPKYKGWASEKVYDDLVKNSVEVQIPIDMHLDLGSDSKPGKGKGNVNVRIMGDGDGPPVLSEDELEQIRNEIKNAMIDAVAAVGVGKVPAGIRRLIADIVEPKIDWRQMLELHVQSLVKNDYTFTKPNRKAFGSGIVLPGMNYDEMVEVHACIDASGSIGKEQLRDFLSELKGIMDSFPEYKIHCWSWDTECYNYQVFTQENGDDMINYEWVKGGGGTAPACCWELLKEKDMTPDKLVMFTDGIFGMEEIEEYANYCDTLFIIHNKHNPHIQMPFGVTVYYDAD